MGVWTDVPRLINTFAPVSPTGNSFWNDTPVSTGPDVFCGEEVVAASTRISSRQKAFSTACSLWTRLGDIWMEKARHDLHALEWLGLHFSRRDVVATRNKLAANNLSLTTLS